MYIQMEQSTDSLPESNKPVGQDQSTVTDIERPAAPETIVSYSFLSKLYSLLTYLPKYFSNLFRNTTAVIKTVSTK